jgi:hypothetical protein
MAEKRTLVNTYVVRMECDRCHNGVLLPTGKILLSDPPKFPHKCSFCEHEMTYDVKYPTTILEDAVSGEVETLN